MFKHIPLSVSLPLLSLLLLSNVRASAPASSPTAIAELICHTAHASACYPAIFHPTEHFQPIHDDQSVPAGLHIRINLATGLKEGRLNVPEPLGTPHSDLVIIDDQPLCSNVKEDGPVVELQDQSDADTRQGRRPYSPAASDVEESSLFYSSIAALHSTRPFSSRDLPALAALQDLAHSIHWGIALARDTAICQNLVSAIYPGIATSAEVRSAAALLLGTAIHSNPDALDALLSHPYSSDVSNTPVANVLAALGDSKQEDIMFKTRTVFLLSQLCQNVEQLRFFVQSEGLTTLFKLVELAKMSLDDGKDKFRAKVANFLYDRILSSIGSAKGLVLQPGSEIIGLQNEGLVKDLGLWCKAFVKASIMYKSVGMSAGNLSPAADTAYESIRETHQALMEGGICAAQPLQEQV